MIQAMHIQPHQLAALEMLQIEAALRKEDSVAHVFASAACGHAQIFRIFGGCQGVCVTQIHIAGQEHHLYVWLVAGRGILLHLADLWNMLEQVAASQGCCRVIARPTERLAEIYRDRLGFQVDGAVVSKEVNRGRWRLNDN